MKKISEEKVSVKQMERFAPYVCSQRARARAVPSSYPPNVATLIKDDTKLNRPIGGGIESHTPMNHSLLKDGVNTYVSERVDGLVLCNSPNGLDLVSVS